MNFLTEVSPLIKTIELKHEPIIITINNFDEESASAFSVCAGTEMACHFAVACSS